MNKEYGFDTTVNYPEYEEEMPCIGWFSSIDACLVAVRKLMEDEPRATSFLFSIVQRDHDER